MMKMGKPIRVVHLTTVHHPYDPRIYFKQCMSLHQNGYEVTLIAQQDEQQKTDDTIIHHIPLKTYKNRWKRMLFGTFDAYRKAKRQKADIYVFHDPELLFVGKLLKKTNNTVIYDIHEDYVTSILQKTYLPKLLRKLIAKGYTSIEKWCTRNMEISLAEKYYYDIYQRGTCILNYPLLNKTNIQHRRNKPLTNKILYTGNVTVDRGALIHAHIPKIDPAIDVQFVGKCSSKLAEEMYEVAEDKNSQVHIKGIDQFIVKDEIDAMYVQENWLAGIALFPPTAHYMKKELTKFFEYMNAGLPIICSNFPIWKTFVETHQCGIAVDPYNEEEIKEALESLRKNPELAIQMGENGKKAVQEELNWKAEEKKLIHWYDQLVKGTCER